MRRCFREPIPEIYAAADKLRHALEAHRRGDGAACHRLIVEANDPAIRDWVAPFLGASSKNPFLQARPSTSVQPLLPKAVREPVRMPTKSEREELIRRQGYACGFCGIPLVRAEVRKALHLMYPEAAVWGRTNAECHAALLTMWLQYDHVLPHSRGGLNSLDNLILTCAACNYGRMSYTLEEVGILNPTREAWPMSAWDGLEGFLDRPVKG